MKKSNFVEGAMIATIGIIVCKIIGLFYVIPFKQIIGEQGGALYGYAYSIYAIFLSLSSTGIPIAMSKIISEYNVLEYHNTKERAYKLGKLIIMSIGFISFIVLMLFAPMIAKLILGDLEGGNTVEGVTMVIRVVSTALLVVPVLSVQRGYLQGHNFMTPASLSNVIDQLARVFVIIFGSFLALKVFNQSLETAVGIAVFGATVGAIIAYFYLLSKMRKNRTNFNHDQGVTRAEARITSKDILKKITYYALPFIIIDLIKSLFAMVDTFTVVKTMVALGHGEIAEQTIGILTVWGSKLNVIIISIAVGFTISLIPNISSSYVKKDYKDVSRKINQALQIIMFISLPMTVGLSFLAGPTWTIFYGHDILSIEIYKIFAIQALSFSFYSILIDTAQTLNDSKLSLGTLIASFFAKLFFNVPMMYLFNYLNIGVYYAPIVTTMLIHLFGIGFILYFLKKKYQVNYTITRYNSLKTILITGIMYISLKILNVFYALNSKTKVGAIKEIAIYAFVGAVIYFVVAYKSKLIDNIFGDKMIEDIKLKFKLKRSKK